MTPNEALYWCEQFTDNVIMADPQREKMVLALQAMRECKKALEKQIPKKPKGDYHSVPHYRCPSCNSAVKVFEDAHEYHWCLYCGQALDWSDTE